MYRAIIIALGFVLVFTDATSQNLDLFRFVAKESVNLNAAQSNLLSEIMTQPTTIAVELVTFENLERLKEASSIRISMPGIGNVFAFSKRVVSKVKNCWSWSGSFLADTGSVFLSATESDIHGTIRYRRKVFTIVPLGDGLHALIKVDPTKMLMDEPADWNPSPASQQSEIMGIQESPYGSQSLLTSTSIDVMIVYTPAVAQATGNINGVVNACMDAANDSYPNSDVSVTLNLVDSFRVNYTESGSTTTDVYRLKETNEGYMDIVHCHRNQFGADLVVLLIHSTTDGSRGAPWNIEVSADGAFAVVLDSYATGYPYQFAHEIGHLIGGRHDNDASGSYNHGYDYHNAYWKTIMAVSYPDTDGRINNWSNPDITYGGVPTGTANSNDNARKWDERASTVAGFRTAVPLSVAIDGPDYVWGKHWYDYTATPSSNCATVTYQWYKDEGYGWQTLGTGSQQSVWSGMTSYTVRCDIHDPETRADATNEMFVFNEEARPAESSSPDAITLLKDFSLGQNYPNPFNPETEISFGLPEPSDVTITISDLIGREVVRLTSTRFSAGYHTLRWAGTDASGGKVVSGIYFYRINAVGESGKRFTKVMKMLLAK